MKQTKKVSSIAAIVAVVGLFASIANVQADSKNQSVTISASVAETLTLACDNAVIAEVTAGISQSTVEACTITTNAESGFNVKVKRDAATDTLTHFDTTTTIVDAADFNGTNAATWSEGTTKGLGFRVAKTSDADDGVIDWGTDGAGAKYSAFPVADTTIYNTTGYSETALTMDVEYRLDVPVVQKSGNYTGSVTYTATTNP